MATKVSYDFLPNGETIEIKDDSRTNADRTTTEEVVAPPPASTPAEIRENLFGLKQGTAQNMAYEKFLENDIDKDRPFDYSVEKLDNQELPTNKDEITKATILEFWKYSDEAYFSKEKFDAKEEKYGDARDKSVIYETNGSEARVYIWDEKMVISFRGTDMYSGSNWWTNTTIRTRKFSDYDLFKKRMNLDKLSDLELHKGFGDAMLITYDTVRLQIDTFRGRNLILTGHSLGGAMANLFYYIYERDVINVEKKLPITHCVTFGSPRSIRNYEPYSIRYNTQCPNNIRIFNKLDIVPYLPRRRAMTDFDNTSDDIDEEFTKQYPSM